MEDVDIVSRIMAIEKAWRTCSSLNGNLLASVLAGCRTDGVAGVEARLRHERYVFAAARPSLSPGRRPGAGLAVVPPMRV